MPMWYVDGLRFNDNYTQEMDDFLYKTMGAGWSGVEKGKENVAFERSHGNPFLDVSSVAWHESTARMAGQMSTYRTEDEARASGEAPSRHGYKEMFENIPEMWDQNHGFHIIDIDDPELVEHGEAYVHERLTSYISEPFREHSDAVPPYVRSYVDRNTVNGLAHGLYTGLPAVFLEPLRQRLGFPYEWWGAPID
jgi:hypothetical protein